MNSPAARAALAVAVAWLAACNRSPIAPASTWLKINGPATIAPGATAQFHAALLSSDSVTRDVTTTAQWSSSRPDIIDMRSNGVAVARARGEANLIASQEAHSDVIHALVLEDGTFKLSGRVFELNTNNKHAVEGAKIEVTAGTGAGLVTVSDATGAYALYGVAGNASLSVSADRYDLMMVTVSVVHESKRDISLTSVPAGVNLSGTWRLTVSANPICTTLPEDARSRELVVLIAHAGAQWFDALLSGPTVSSTDPIEGQILGDTIKLNIRQWPGDVVDNPYYALLVTVQPKGYLGIWGTVTASLDGSGAGVLDGGFDYYPSAIITPARSPCAGRTPATLTREQKIP